MAPAGYARTIPTVRATAAIASGHVPAAAPACRASSAISRNRGERPRLHDDADLLGTHETHPLDGGMSPGAFAARCGHDAPVMPRSYAKRTKKADATPLPAAPVRRGDGPLLFTTEKSVETAPK